MRRHLQATSAEARRIPDRPFGAAFDKNDCRLANAGREAGSVAVALVRRSRANPSPACAAPSVPKNFEYGNGVEAYSPAETRTTGATYV